MTLDDYRFAVACPDDASKVLDFVRRRPSQNVSQAMVGHYGGDWAARVCDGDIALSGLGGAILAAPPTATGPRDPTPTPTPVSAAQPHQPGAFLPIVPEQSTTPTPTPTATPAPTRTPIPTPTPVLRPEYQLAEARLYMLGLINTERTQAGLGTVTLGDNVAAQLHAEASLEHCFSSHWGIDGLKPYMRYGLGGGYQTNRENGAGLSYCIRAHDGYRAIASVEQEMRRTVERWMDIPGHRRNVLDEWHRKVSIGLAWDAYNFVAVQHFEGDYVTYPRLPTLANGVLTITGTTKNGVVFNDDQTLAVQIHYDPLPHALTRGQLSRTYCYENGRPIAGLRAPSRGGWSYALGEFWLQQEVCTDPYDVSPDALAPDSYAEAHAAWRAAASLLRPSVISSVPWITASEWIAGGEYFFVTADLTDILAEHGTGVYSIIVRARMATGEDAVISQYSLFHGVEIEQSVGGSESE